MRLPFGERARVDIGKLENYCLSDVHARGRHKARLFDTLLGVRREHSDWLRQQLLEAAASYEAAVHTLDDYGQHYVLDFELKGPGGTAGIILHNEQAPRFVTCYIL